MPMNEVCCRVFKFYIFSLLILLITSCASNDSSSDEFVEKTVIQLPEETKLLTDGRIFSSRCAGYDRLGGRNKGVNEAQELAKKDAISANHSLVSSHFTDVTQCKEEAMTMECIKSLDSLTQIVSEGFLRTSKKKIVDYSDDIVCVSLTGLVSLPKVIPFETNIVVSPKISSNKKTKEKKTSRPVRYNPVSDDLVGTTNLENTSRVPILIDKINVQVSGKSSSVHKAYVKHDNLLINGDLKQHYSVGWTLLNGKQNGIKKADITPNGFRFSFKGKGGKQSQWELSQQVSIDVNRPFYFESTFFTSDDIYADVYPVVKLQFIDNNHTVIAENVWTADEYYDSNSVLLHNLISLGSKQVVQFDSENLLHSLLSKEKVNKIDSVKVVFDVSAPESERCRLCILTIESAKINYL
ncbi:hypothetical protein [Vibrio cortegadensis]|uniref:hypothetical protein n=1 Tax=Vibrio cortegadensis TaxID=1328770 RepID=UPI00352E80B9